MYFQQATQKGPLKRSEWEKRKKRLMAFFAGNVKVKAHGLYIYCMKDVFFFKLQDINFGIVC